MTTGDALFNLKAVVQQTGLKPDTLRAWERRYGLPSPARSGGRQRLYTLRDIEALRWLAARQAEGLSISRAVELWRQLEAGGQDPLLLPGPIRAGSSVSLGPRSGVSTLDRLRQEWLAACLAYDEQSADQVAVQASALYPAEVVCTELLLWAMREVGHLWQEGQASVQQEHFTSELSIRRVESLLSAAPQATRHGRILAACPPGEHHTFSLLLLTLLLRRHGWSVVFLGADVPVARLEASVATVQPDLIVLAAQRLLSAASLSEMALAVHELAPVGYGGEVFNALAALRAHIPGHFLGRSLDEATSAVASLLASPLPAARPEPVPEGSRAALKHFRERRGAIGAELVDASAAHGQYSEQLDHVAGALADHIQAALALGDISLLDADAAGLGIEFRELPVAALAGFLRAYLRAAEKCLDWRGERVLAWLRTRAVP